MVFLNDRCALLKLNKKNPSELIFKCQIVHEDQVKTCLKNSVACPKRIHLGLVHFG